MYINGKSKASLIHQYQNEIDIKNINAFIEWKDIV